jgi:hypothetical protein
MTNCLQIMKEKLQSKDKCQKIANALSRRNLIVQEFHVDTLGFQHLKEMYKGDNYFKEAYEASTNPLLGDRS